METSYKFGQVNDLHSAVKFDEERVSFKNIFETAGGGVSVLAMKKGQFLDTHTAPFEVMVIVCEGEVEFTMIDMKNTIRSGQFLLMGADVAHSVRANEDSKLMLVKVKG